MLEQVQDDGSKQQAMNIMKAAVHSAAEEKVQVDTQTNDVEQLLIDKEE